MSCIAVSTREMSRSRSLTRSSKRSRSKVAGDVAGNRSETCSLSIRRFYERPQGRIARVWPCLDMQPYGCLYWQPDSCIFVRSWMTRDEMDDVFKALADPSRRQLLDSLKDRGGQNLRELCAGLNMARQSVSKHLAVLEAANLVATVRHGREKLHYVNVAPINDIAQRWINRYDQGRVHALSDLKQALEETTMEKPTFVYKTYINTTPERLWQALTEPAFTRRYWNTTLESDWKVGSTITWDNQGVRIEDPAQVVLECEPFRRLSYSWHTFTPEL